MNDWKLLLDDLAQLFAASVGMADGLRKDTEQKMKLRMEKWAKKMDFVSRREFEVLQEMVKKSREQQERLLDELAAIKKSARSKSSPPTAARKSKPVKKSRRRA